MEKKMNIIYNDETGMVSIKNEIHAQELYNVYCAVTAHVASELNNKEDIIKLSAQAALDALKMMENVKIETEENKPQA